MASDPLLAEHRETARARSWLGATFAAALLVFPAGCIPLVAGANTYRPAGELESRGNAMGVSLELGRVLTNGLAVSRPEDAAKNVWFGESIDGQFHVAHELAVEASLLWASAIPFLIPVPIGGRLGVRRGLLRQEAHGVSMDVAARGAYASASLKSGDQAADGAWRLATKAMGAELELPVSYRPASWFAVTLTPFSRFYRVTAESKEVRSGADVVRKDGVNVVSGGASLALELLAGPVAIAPALAIEAIYFPHDRVRMAQPMPGLSFGGRW
ncbi:MAG: hypothetical protein HY903_03725 [Deltaproteobacteria bacterium]|nr:hypothetical protein [Deltaproteobacteria bacterium]